LISKEKEFQEFSEKIKRLSYLKEMTDDYIFEKYKRALQSPLAAMPNSADFTQEQRDCLAHLRHRALLALILD
jgi:hypothetical protein